MSAPHPTGEADARRFAAGPPPSTFLAGHGPDQTVQTADGPAPFDPLRLCIFATIALLGWVFGPAALVVFATIGFVGYARARRAGLTRSRCYLRDTRLVLAYLAVLAVAGLVGAGWWVARLAGMA
ncbi:hypothetical protein [Propioniciclava sp.]|uniref:hypothetical protein n=1 Tax=Propioniciclava sp. TaxID=2038686 RepID=UPI0026370824|nr:hypothetical protein [Propioniciclava sp.]